MNTILAIFIGGGVGSVTRFGLSRYVTSGFQEINPLATLLSNLFSTIILGVIIFLAGNKFDLSGTMKALLIIGFCGGFSTFSTFSYETFELIRNGNYIFATINMAISVLLGIGVLFFLARNF